MESKYPEFYSICAALRRNDPNCTQVGAFYDKGRCPDESGLMLGSALRNNTNVRAIELRLRYVLHRVRDSYGNPIRVPESPDSILYFLRHSSSLRTVKLWPHATLLPNQSFGSSCRYLLDLMVEAIADNPYGPIALTVDRERLILGIPPMGVRIQALTRALQVSKSIEKLMIWLGMDHNESFEIRRGFQRGPILDGNSLGDPVESARTLLAKALRDNCYLKHLEILPGSCKSSVSAVLRVLPRNGSLCTVVCDDLNRDQLGQVRMYCTRNQQVNDLLAKLTRDSEEGSVDSNAVLPMIPRVFAVVQHSRRMAACRMMQACLALSQDVGPKPDKKRSACDLKGL
jgi:hypothetical protein